MMSPALWKGAVSPIQVVAVAVLFGAGSAAGAAAAQPLPAQPFVNAAAQSDAYEIAAGQLILTQSVDPKVRQIAEQMIEDHRKTSADLTAAAQASRLDPPEPGLGGDQQRMLSALQSLKGADLDRGFMIQQINAHAAALVTEQEYLAAGSDPNLRKVARGAILLIERHLEMARRMAPGAAQ
jgi:putative membrane protein